MKKVLYFISAIAVMACAIACGDNKGPDKIDDQTGKITRISQLRDKWDYWDFVYNEKDQIVKVDRDNGDRVWNIAWNDKTASVTGRDEFSFVLGDNGMISTLTWKDGTAYSFTYDKDGYLTQSKKGDAVNGTFTITGGNVTKIVEGENTFEFTYGSDLNANGIQVQYQDEYNKFYPTWYRFIIESGLLGKAPKNMPTSFKYNGTKICDYVFEHITFKAGDKETPDDDKTVEQRGYVLGKEYTIMKTGHLNDKAELKEDIHKYVFEEYKPAK